MRVRSISIVAICAMAFAILLSGSVAVFGEEAVPFSRYVFFDTSQVESCTGFTHVMNPAVRRGQVIFPDKPWESKGVWCWVSVAEYEGRYHLWYDAVGANGRWHLCYARSTDGLHWEKPSLGLIEYEGNTENNIVYLGRPSGNYHGGTVFLDPHGESDARFKFVYGGGPLVNPMGHMGVDAAVSPDGIHFRPGPACPITPWYTDCGNVAFWDDARNAYVLYVRYWGGNVDFDNGAMHIGSPMGKRCVGRTESTDFFHFPKPVKVLEPDAQDPDDMEMYNSAAHQYPWAHDTYLSFFSAFYLMPDTVDVQIATSPDGIQWKRAIRTPFLPMGMPGSFDALEVYMGHGMLLSSSNEILMYYGGFDVRHGASDIGPGRGGIGVCSVRKDGFFSMDAGYGGGDLVTNPILVDGERLTLNADASAGGALRVELQDESGMPIPGYSLAEAEMIRNNSVDGAVAWKSGNDISSLRGKKIKLHFVGRDAKLYAFGFAPFL